MSSLLYQIISKYKNLTGELPTIPEEIIDLINEELNLGSIEELTTALEILQFIPESNEELISKLGHLIDDKNNFYAANKASNIQNLELKLSLDKKVNEINKKIDLVSENTEFSKEYDTAYEFTDVCDIIKELHKETSELIKYDPTTKEKLHLEKLKNYSIHVFKEFSEIAIPKYFFYQDIESRLLSTLKDIDNLVNFDSSEVLELLENILNKEFNIEKKGSQFSLLSGFIQSFNKKDYSKINLGKIYSILLEGGIKKLKEKCEEKNNFGIPNQFIHLAIKDIIDVSSLLQKNKFEFTNEFFDELNKSLNYMFQVESKRVEWEIKDYKKHNIINTSYEPNVYKVFKPILKLIEMFKDKIKINPESFGHLTEWYMISLDNLLKGGSIPYALKLKYPLNKDSIKDKINQHFEEYDPSSKSYEKELIFDYAVDALHAGIKINKEKLREIYMERVKNGKNIHKDLVDSLVELKVVSATDLRELCKHQELQGNEFSMHLKYFPNKTEEILYSIPEEKLDGNDILLALETLKKVNNLNKLNKLCSSLLSKNPEFLIY